MSIPEKKTWFHYDYSRDDEVGTICKETWALCA